MNLHLIETKLNMLPDDLKKEVYNFIEFLLNKKKEVHKVDPFDFNWEGGLAEFKQEFNSVNLQKKSLEWR